MLKYDIRRVRQRVLVTVAEVGDVLRLSVCDPGERKRDGTHTADDGDVALPFGRSVATRLFQVSILDHHLFSRAVFSVLVVSHDRVRAVALIPPSARFRRLYTAAGLWMEPPRRNESKPAQKIKYSARLDA